MANNINSMQTLSTREQLLKRILPEENRVPLLTWELDPSGWAKHSNPQQPSRRWT